MDVKTSDAARAAAAAGGARSRTVRVADLAAALACDLCGGVLLDAVTAPACMHR